MQSMTTKEKSSPRDKRLPETRVSARELAIIKNKAIQAGLSQSEYQRRILLDGAIIIPPQIANQDLIKELIHQGTNLNQYVRKLNGLGQDSPKGIEQTRLRIESLLDALMT